MVWVERRGKNIRVSGALKIKEEERNKKQAALSYSHLERNNARLNGWMILKFESRIPNTHMQRVSKIQLDPTVQVGDMGFAS